MMSSGKKPHLHLVGEIDSSGNLRTACGHKLQKPSIGVGLDQCLECEAPWSPRCWKALPAEWQVQILGRS